MINKQNTLEKLRNNLQNQNTNALRTLDTSSVSFDGDYYNNRFRMVQLYNSIYVKRNDPVSIKAISSVLTLLVASIVIVCPLIPMAFLLAVTIKKEEQRINSKYR